MGAVRRALLGVVVLFATSGVTRADTHKDEDLGFSINVPKGWSQVPIAGEDKYIVAKYLGRKMYSKKENEGHTPEMRVILFPSGAKKGATVEETEGGIAIRFNNPYKNYKEFLKANSYGGYFVSKEEEGLVNGVATTMLEVKFEKLTVPRRLVAWIFHADEADYAASFEVLEDYWDKSSPEFVQCLKSFKLFARKAALPGQTTGDSVVINDITKLTPEQRAKRRLEKFDRALQTEIKRLPEGWTQKRSKNYVALSHVDDKYTQRVLDQAEGVRTWVDGAFPWIGNGIPGPVMIRICKDSDEERAYKSTSSGSGWFSEKAEITMSKDLSSGAQSFEFQWVNEMIMHYWFKDKNQALTSALPGWLEEGLDEFVMTAVMKGKSLDFRPDEWEVKRLRETAKAGKLASPRTMVLAPWDEFEKTDNPKAQAGALVRFLLDGPGKAGRSKGALEAYLRALSAYLEEQDKKEKAASGASEDAPKTEEEEEERFKARQKKWKDEEKALLQALFDRTFGSWDDGNWKVFEQGFTRFVG